MAPQECETAQSISAGASFRRRKWWNLALPAAAAGAPLLLLALFAALLWQASPAAAAGSLAPNDTLTVCPSGCAYKTIQDAVNAALPGDEIQIRAGTYNESVDLALMGSDFSGSIGDITLYSWDNVLISSSAGPALYASAQFLGNITLENLNFTSADDAAVLFTEVVDGNVSITGGSASGAAYEGLWLDDVIGSVTISGTLFEDNGNSGVVIYTYLVPIGCAPLAAAQPTAQSAVLPAAQPAGAGGPVDTVTLVNTKATGNGGTGFEVNALYGNIVVDNSQAQDNGANGFDLSIADLCEGSQVRIEGSSALRNGNFQANFGTGFQIEAANVIVRDTDASNNACDGIAQEPNLYDATAADAADVRSLGGSSCQAPGLATANAVRPQGLPLPSLAVEIVDTSALSNSRHGINVGAIEFVTVTHVNAMRNGDRGIRVFYTPPLPLGPLQESAIQVVSPAGLLPPGMSAVVRDSLVISNNVGVELNDEELLLQAAGPVQPLGEPLPENTGAVTNNIICHNDAAGLVSSGTVNNTYNAVANYWGSSAGPYHATKNATVTNNQVVDATNPSTFPNANGDVIFDPWINDFLGGFTPQSGLVGQPTAFSLYAIVYLGTDPSLFDGPGNRNEPPPFHLVTDNGVVTTPYGAGAEAPAKFDSSGYLTATLVPATPGLVTLTLEGPCGPMSEYFLFVQEAQLVVTKDPAAQAVVSGGTAQFSITVSNTGEVNLANVVVADPLSPACSRSLPDLAPNASASFTCTQAAVTADFTNQVTVTADAKAAPPTLLRAAFPQQPANGVPTVVISATDMALVDVVNPSLNVLKSAGSDPNACAPVGPVTVPISSSIYYCLTLANTGDVTLTNHLVNDAQLGIVAAPVPYVLAPGSSVAITRSVLPRLGPIVVSRSITNVVTITSTGQVSQVGGIVVPTVSVAVQNAGSVVVNTTPTGLEPGEEPVGDKKVYLPALGR